MPARACGDSCGVTRAGCVAYSLGAAYNGEEASLAISAVALTAEISSATIVSQTQPRSRPYQIARKGLPETYFSRDREETPWEKYSSASILTDNSLRFV